MEKTSIGEMISRLRKKAGFTQEELGKAVGVSTQAVSRWECGGTPDIELLPAIADKLSVSIDTLFGRDETFLPDVGELLYRAIRQLPEEKRMEKALEYVWILQRAVLATNNIPAEKTVTDMLTAITESDRSNHPNPYRAPWYIALGNDYGSMYYGIASDMRFALLLPSGPGGIAAKLKYTEEYRRLFALLAKPGYLDMLIDIYRRPPGQSFTDRSAAARLNISVEEARAILDDLYNHCLVKRSQVSDDKEDLYVYGTENTGQLGVFLFMCQLMMHSNHEPHMLAELCNKPGINDVPGTNALTPEWITKDKDSTSRKAYRITTSSDDDY